MAKKDIQSILKAALEEEIPASQIQLWGRVKERLVPGRQPSFLQGEKMKSIRSRHLQRVVLTLLTITALMAAALITPQGRAFAQDILKFFQRAESNVIPLSPDQIVPTEELEAVPTAAPPAPLMTISEAYQVVGFSFRLPQVPEGFVLLGARANSTSISIEYEAQGGGGALILNESLHEFVQSEWDQAPAEAISQVRIGNIEAEIVQGGFVVFPGETVARWNPDAAILRLRWVFDGIWFEMTKFGNVEAIQYLDRDALLELAEHMLNGSFTLDIKEAESLAGFDVLEPTWLPPVLFFQGAAFEPKEWGSPKDTVKLSYYFYSDKLGPGLASNGVVITQQPTDSIEDCQMGLDCLVGAGADVETVQIGDMTGEYVVGIWEAGNAGNWIWRQDPYLQRLRWQENDMAFEILYMGPPEEVGKIRLDCHCRKYAVTRNNTKGGAQSIPALLFSNHECCVRRIIPMIAAASYALLDLPVSTPGACAPCLKVK
jgi:hypothetical protein